MYNANDILVATQVNKAHLVHYELDFAGSHYDILYEHGYVRVEKNGEQIFLQQIFQQDDSSWDDNEAVMYISLIKEAIRNGTIEALELPRKSAI